MGRRKIGQEKIRNIQKSGSGYTVSIPVELIRDLGWRERQKVTITRSGRGKIVIEDYKD